MYSWVVRGTVTGKASCTKTQHNNLIWALSMTNFLSILHSAPILLTGNMYYILFQIAIKLKKLSFKKTVKFIKELWNEHWNNKQRNGRVNE